MEMPKFSEKSLDKLNTCHVDLITLFREVINHRDCTVLKGYRDEAEQTKAFAEGRSNARYGQSKHNFKPSRAVDVAPYPIDWNNKARFDEFAGFVMGIAAQLGIKIKWGGHFEGFYDGPHFELSD